MTGPDDFAAYKVPNTLDELLEEGNPGRPYTVLAGHNMGNNTIIMSIPMHQFYEISEVANERNLTERVEFKNTDIAQRKLDEKHATKLANYILKGLLHSVANRFARSGKAIPEAVTRLQQALGRQPYLALQPIVANIRECQAGGAGLRIERRTDGATVVYLLDKHILWVVDGQHRRYGMEIAFDWLKSVVMSRRYPKRPHIYIPEDGTQDVGDDDFTVWNLAFEQAKTKCSVIVEVHLGLGIEQERQLFHDLNNLTKKIEASLAFQFDSSNPINLFIKERLIEDGILEAKVVEKDVIDWDNDTGQISRKDLVAVNAILFLNKTNIRDAKPEDVNEKTEQCALFWSKISSIPHFGEPSAKQKTVAAQPVVLKALAKLTYDFAFGRGQDQNHLQQLLEGIAKIDFSHRNPMWRYYELSDDEKISLCEGLSEYLPKEDGGNRDIGGYDKSNYVMRFGAKHNDIYPILGDMIRWCLKLPIRHTI